jgi:hypothetical protein
MGIERAGSADDPDEVNGPAASDHRPPPARPEQPAEALAKHKEREAAEPGEGPSEASADTGAENSGPKRPPVSGEKHGSATDGHAWDSSEAEPGRNVAEWNEGTVSDKNAKTPYSPLEERPSYGDFDNLADEIDARRRSRENASALNAESRQPTRVELGEEAADASAEVLEEAPRGTEFVSPEQETPGKGGRGLRNHPADDDGEAAGGDGGLTVSSFHRLIPPMDTQRGFGSPVPDEESIKEKIHLPRPDTDEADAHKEQFQRDDKDIEGTVEAVRYLDAHKLRTPAGEAFYGVDDIDMRRVALSLPPEQGKFTADLHGNPESVNVGGRSLTAHDLASFLESEKSDWSGEPIRLFSCDTGKGEDPFAQKLADRLGVAVTAPTELAWSDIAGNSWSATKTKNAKGDWVSTWPPDGEWVTFNRKQSGGTL